MLEMSPISSYRGAQPSTPLVDDGLVDDTLQQTGPCCNEALLQISNVEYTISVQ